LVETYAELRQSQLFKRTIDYIASSFQVMRLSDAIALLEEGKLKGKVAALTFDDGDASLQGYILPVLQEKGLPATFFINSAYYKKPSTYWFPVLSYLNSADETHPEWTEELREQASKLRNTQNPAFYNDVRERVEALAHLVPGLDARLVPAGWLARLDSRQYEIGAHGHEHERHSMMSEDWQAGNLDKNVRFLSQFAAFRPVFAVPFGRPWDWTPATVSIARERGLKTVLSHGGAMLRPARPMPGCRRTAGTRIGRFRPCFPDT
jgi:peptidoglycan/xylan/chitin deacetylase (PgdA/CDA1 family)